MFSLPTLPKLFVLAAIVFVIYLWSKGRAVQARGGQGAAPRANTGGRAQAKPANTQQKAIEDLVKCPSCGTYIAAGSSCGCGQARR